ncbi:MAG TPA: hypothetical protein VIY48_18855 [Candidatus Paceibacterota bacterium]
MGGSIGLAAALIVGLTASAATPGLFGGGTNQTSYTELISNTSNASSSDDYSGISFTIPASTTVSALGTLSARYNVVDTDCGGGSPRFQINVASSTNASSTMNIFAYLGPAPNYTGCQQNTWVTSGNLLDGTKTLDTSQLPGGTAYDSWAHVQSAYGNYVVTGVQLVADGGWATGGVQRVRVTDANVGGTAYTFPTQTGTSTGTTTTLMAPTNLSPTNGASLTSAQWTSAQWSTVSGSSTPITYLYESSNASTTKPDGSFTSAIYQSGPLSSPQISTTGTGAGVYWWHARAVDNSGAMSAWSMPTMVTVTAGTSTGTTTPPCGATNLIGSLQGLQGQYPSYTTQLQSLIDQLNASCNGGTGTTTPPTNNTATIDNPTRDTNVGGSVDWVGRGFGHEETVNIMRNGTSIGAAHADGGGNFSTGSMSVPATAGTYTYTFTGATSGMTATATLTVH